MVAELMPAALAGGLLGVATGLIPGIHPNTLALLAAALLGSGASEPAAVILVAAATSHTFVSFLPATFLGAPDPDQAAGVLPAHALLHEGRGLEAVDLSARGSAWGLALGLGFLIPLRFLLAPPANLLVHVQALLAPILVVVVGALLLAERRRVPYRRALEVEPGGSRRATGTLEARDGALLHLRRGPRLHDPLGWLEDARPGDRVEAEGAWTRVQGRLSRPLGIALALVVLALAGALGLLLPELAAASPLGLPGTPLFPALTGLFGVPPLLLALRSGVPPLQDEPVPDPAPMGAACLRGSLWAGLAAVLPGVTPAHATAFALAGRRDLAGAEDAVLVLSATNTAAAVLALGVFAAAAKPRTGVLLEVAALWPPAPWTGFVPPPGTLDLVAATVVGGVVGYAATRRAGRWMARHVAGFPTGRLALGILGLLAALAWAFEGVLGLVVLGASAVLGLLPWRVGVRRSHLMGVLLVPILLSALAATL